MPTLEPTPEPPAGPAERISTALRRGAAAVGADHRVTLRVLLALWVLGMAASFGPTPWPQIAVVALVILVSDWARMTRMQPPR